MFNHHGRCGGRHGGRRGPRGGDRWDRFASEFAARWEEKQRGGGRGGRMFDGGELRLVLLKLIADEPRHGYDLIRVIEEMTGGAYVPSPGVVYPTLAMLDEMDLIAEQKVEGAKKLFAITDAGRAHLAENEEHVAALMARLAAVGEMRERTDRAPIRRAMGNLRQVLQHRLTRDDADNDTLLDVAAIIDEAAQKIERLK